MSNYDDSWVDRDIHCSLNIYKRGYEDGQKDGLIEGTVGHRLLSATENYIRGQDLNDYRLVEVISAIQAVKSLIPKKEADDENSD